MDNPQADAESPRRICVSGAYLPADQLTVAPLAAGSPARFAACLDVTSRLAVPRSSPAEVRRESPTEPQSRCGGPVLTGHRASLDRTRGRLVQHLAGARPSGAGLGMVSMSLVRGVHEA